MHLVGAYLDLDRRAEGPEQRGVHRLIAVQFRDRDVILELAGYRLVQAVQHTQRDVTGIEIVDQNPETVDIQHLGKSQRFALHLAVDAVDVLFPSAHVRFDMVLGKPLAYRFEYLADHFAAVAARDLQGL